MFSFLKGKGGKEASSSGLAGKLAGARALAEQGRLEEAAALCVEILQIRGDDVDALLLAGEIATRQGDLQGAIPYYAKFSALRPESGFAHFMLGNLFIGCGQLEAALGSYERAAALDAGRAEVFCNRGVVLERLDRLDAALASYGQALALDPGNALAHYNRAAVLSRLERPQEALASYEQAIAFKPDYAEAYFNRGNVLKGLRRWEEALASYDQAIECNPHFAQAYGYRGALLYERERPDAALASYDRAIELDPGYAEAHYNRGVLRQRQKQSELAMADYEKAIELVPHYAEAHMNRGALLYANKHYDEALKSFDQAIELDPHYAHAYFNRATLLVKFRQLDAALADVERVIELNPSSVDAHHMRGAISFDLKRFPDAAASFERVRSLEPDYRANLGMLVLARMTMCDWRNFESDVLRITTGIEAGLPLSPPLSVLAILDRPDLQQRAAQIWAREEAAVDDPLPMVAPRPSRGKIRIGYFSADFHQHIVAMVTAQLFELHDRSKFEIIAFSFSPDADDDMRRRLQRAFDRFLDVSAMPDREVALLARSLDIDIAVDLGGYTTGCRTKIFALRAAPIQINFLGFPGTMGVPFMDYLIGDRTVVPESHQRHYTEKIIYLPNSFLPYDATTKISTQQFTREQFGLPSGGFVFCCFNSPYKILPDVFDTWMRILAKVPNGVLWFTQSNESVIANLHHEAKRRGVDAQRLIFAEHMHSLPDHLARHALGDLLLDTRPYNAHATAMDALWARLPVLTLIGDSFASRVAASLLRTFGLPELITETPEQYEALAVELAMNPARLATIRRTLVKLSVETPLFEAPSFTRHLESAYVAVHQRHRLGLGADHISVDPESR